MSADGPRVVSPNRAQLLLRPPGHSRVYRSFTRASAERAPQALLKCDPLRASNLPAALDRRFRIDQEEGHVLARRAENTKAQLGQIIVVESIAVSDVPESAPLRSVGLFHVPEHLPVD